MELTFIKDGNLWISEFEVNGDFNLHVEKGAGTFAVMQTTVAGGKSDFVPSLHMSIDDAVMDKDVTALIYPKTILIEARTEEAPYAVISSEGDVLDITNVLNTPV
jgi:hypothetical protein